MTPRADAAATAPTPTPTPAEVYDDLFVPALFAPWAVRIAALADLQPGHEILDVGCGTGALALAAREATGGGRVVGIDPNAEMLAVARRKAAAVEWREGSAESLPFEDGSFDRVVSQFALMFFQDRAAAVREMVRVLRPGGKLVVAVCDALDHSPGYAVLTELLERLFGSEVAGAFRAPFALGDPDALTAIARRAGLADATVSRHDGRVTFSSVEALVSAERACAWTLGGLLDGDELERLARAAEESLRPFVEADGRVVFTMPALCLSTTAPSASDPRRVRSSPTEGS